MKVIYAFGENRVYSSDTAFVFRASQYVRGISCLVW